MELWVRLIRNLLMLMSLCELSILAYDAHATVSNYSSSYSSSYYRECSYVERVKQAAGIYYSRQHSQNQKVTNQSKIIPKEQTRQDQVKNTFAKRLPELKAIAQETQELQALYQEYDAEKHTYFEKRLSALRNVQTGTISHEMRSYQLDGNIIDMLHAHGINKNDYISLFGNKLQQAIHQECINILEQTVNLPLDSPLYEHKSILVECAESARIFNQQGFVDKAIKITNLCWSLLDYGKAIVEGIAAGVVGTIQDVVDHPIETIVSLAIGEYLLAYNLSKVLIEVGHIGITALTDISEAKRKLGDYFEPIAQVIKAIEKEEISLRDAIKGTTQFAVGFYAQSKLLSGIGKFYKGIQAKAYNFISKNPSLGIEPYLATPEGLLLKSVSNSEIKNQSKNILIKKIVNKVKRHKNNSKLWDIVSNNTGKKQYSFNGKVVNLYRDPSRKYWWAKDLTGHGGSCFKVFVENGSGFKWFADADQYGNFIENKHKGMSGLFIKPQ